MNTYVFFKYITNLDNSEQRGLFYELEIIDNIEYYKTFNFIVKKCIDKNINEHPQIEYLPLVTLDRSIVVYVDRNIKKHPFLVIDLSSFTIREKRTCVYRDGMGELFGLDEDIEVSNLLVNNQIFADFLKEEHTKYSFRLQIVQAIQDSLRKNRGNKFSMKIEIWYSSY